MGKAIVCLLTGMAAAVLVRYGLHATACMLCWAVGRTQGEFWPTFKEPPCP